MMTVEGVLAWVGEGGCRDGEESNGLEQHGGRYGVACFFSFVETVEVSLKYEDLVELWSVSFEVDRLLINEKFVVVISACRDRSAAVGNVSKRE